MEADYTEIGIGIKQDMEGAKRWYMRAAGPSAFPTPQIRLFLIEFHSPTKQTGDAAFDGAEQCQEREIEAGEANTSRGADRMCGHVRYRWEYTCFIL